MVKGGTCITLSADLSKTFDYTFMYSYLRDRKRGKISIITYRCQNKTTYRYPTQFHSIVKVIIFETF